MDTRTGQLTNLADIEPSERKHFVKVKRELTAREAKTRKVGRNAPCVCGSGRKAKKCCMIRRVGDGSRSRYLRV